MARNVQIIGLFLAAGVLSLTGCQKKSSLENAYSLEARMDAFTDSETSRTFPAFAEEICVVGDGEDDGTALTAGAAGVLSLSGGEAVFARNMFDRMNPASTTKVMTALVALKYGDLSDSVTVTDASVINEAGSSMAGVVPGDVLTLEQLLYGLLIPSGNDAANAIAVHMSGSVEEFAKRMNEEAVKIGATGTHFANANGLTDPDHYTTAYDLYLMFREALSYEKFREIIGAKSYTAVYQGADGSEKTTVWNVGNYYMNGKAEAPDGLTVFGGKTGTTQAAGYCLIMGSETEDGSEYASVIMHAESRPDLYDDMTKILSKIGN